MIALMCTDRLYPRIVKVDRRAAIFHEITSVSIEPWGPAAERQPTLCNHVVRPFASGSQSTFIRVLTLRDFFKCQVRSDFRIVILQKSGLQRLPRRENIAHRLDIVQSYDRDPG